MASKRFKVLFNCVNNIKGGPVQNSAWFIQNAVQDNDIEFRFLVSKAVFDNLAKLKVFDERIICLDRLSHGFFFVRKLALVEEEAFDPDLVFTLAGPTYIDFSRIHILGMSDGYVSHPDFLSLYSNRNLFEIFRLLPLVLIKSIVSRAQADYLIFQTNYALKKYCHRLFFPKTKAFVVPNAISETFYFFSRSEERLKPSKSIVIFCPAADYPHKDLRIIFPIIDYFKNYAATEFPSIKFVVTVTEESSFLKFPNRYFNTKNKFHVYNHGEYKHADALILYKTAHMVFVPSYFETFSTAYLEAIATSKPLLCADRGFSREICGDAATYFFPRSSKDAARKISEIVETGFSVNRKAGENVLEKYGTQEQRYQAFKKILTNVYELNVTR